MKQRKLLGTKRLDEIVNYILRTKIAVATACRALGVTDSTELTFVTRIVRADLEGNTRNTRPPWLKPEPAIQEAPKGWKLKGGLEGYWINTNVEH